MVSWFVCRWLVELVELSSIPGTQFRLREMMRRPMPANINVLLTCFRSREGLRLVAALSLSLALSLTRTVSRSLSLSRARSLSLEREGVQGEEGVVVV